jgi:hypothetical protein
VATTVNEHILEKRLISFYQNVSAP